MNGFGRGQDGDNKEKSSLITRETVGMTLLLFSSVLLLITATGPFLFGEEVGLAIASFFVGLCGYLCYPLFALAIYLSAVLTFGSKHKLPLKWGLRGGLLLLAVFFIVHTATAARFLGNGYGAYLDGCWNAATQDLANGTGGGVLLGLIVYPVCLLSLPGAYVVFSLFLLLAVWVVLRGTPLRGKISFRPHAARPRERETVKRGGETDGSVPFDDLPSAERHGSVADASRAASSVQQPSSQPVQQSAVRPAAGYSNRDILYGGDPATNYRSNLIYDRDSYFNTRERHSSVEPRYRENPASSSEEPSYTERYSREAESQRPAMPRRVTEQPPAAQSRPQSGYTYPADRQPPREEPNTNYPQAPVYRAPTPPVSRDRDYYANDVEPQRDTDFNRDGFGSRTPEQGNRASETNNRASDIGRTSDVRTPEQGDRTSDIFGRGDRMRDLGQAPGETDFGRTSADEGQDRTVFGRDVFERRETPEESEQPPAPPASESRDTSFRSLFSRPVEERTHFPDLPPAGDPTDEQPGEDPGEELPESRVFDSSRRTTASDLFDEETEDDVDEEPPAPVRGREGRDFRTGGGTPFGEGSQTRDVRGGRTVVTEEPPEQPEPPKPHVYRPYVRPDLDTMQRYSDKKPITQDEIEQNSAVIVDTLRAFKQDVEVVKVTCGPAVVRYDIDVPKNIPAAAVTKHGDDIAMRLCAKDGVNMYNNRARGVVSIEVPKPEDKRSIVGLRSVLEAEEYVNAKPNALVFALGKDVEGRNICGNIVKMTHLLVAGSTGSGKSVFLNAMLISLVCKYSPEDLRLILIDPKKVEFAIYEDLPHLMINEIIIDAQKAVMALNWAIKEMERRYKLFEQKGKATRNAIRDVDGYNAARDGGEEKLPRILIVFDELADFMTVARKEIEERVGRLAAKARAAGIHLVLATQRPSVDVITGVIKNNLPTRIAFRVSSEYDSRTILDEGGAEKLLGYGDMLYRPETGVYRVQGAYVSDEEVRTILNEIRDENEAYFDHSVADYINKSPSASGEGGGDGDDEEEGATPEAIRSLGIVVKLGQASISLIQRKCSIGYAHAGKIIEWMERMGYITPFDGTSKPRTVILTKEEYESKYGPLD